MRRRGRAGKGVAVLVGIAAVLLIIEGIARNVDPALPGWDTPMAGGSGGAIMAGHPTRLWGNHANGVRQNDLTTATINSEGLRGELPELPRPPGRHRLMVLGDSSAFGHGVPDDTTLVDVCGRALVAAGLDVDVVNGAVAGYSIAQSAVLMEEQGWDYDPTLLVITNLWSDNTWDAFHDEDLIASRRMAQYNPLVHSAAFRLLATMLSGSTGGDGGRIITVSKLDPYPQGRVRRVPLQRYAVLVDGLIKEAAAREVGVVFVRNANVFLMTVREHEHPPLWQPYFNVMEALAEHHGVPMVDTTPLFRASGLEDEELFLDLMHPTIVGHEMIGEALAQALLRADWPSSPLLGSAQEFHTDVTDHRVAGSSDGGVGSPQRNLFPQ